MVFASTFTIVKCGNEKCLFKARESLKGGRGRKDSQDRINRHRNLRAENHHCNWKNID